MREWIFSLNDRMHFFIIVGCTIGIAFIIAEFVRFPLEFFIADNDLLVVGVIYQVIGTLYAYYWPLRC